MKKLLTMAVFAALILVSPAQATSPAPSTLPQYTFDKAHTQIFFSVSHLGFSFSTGKFLDFDGGFQFDPAKPTESSVTVAIKTNSIDMDDQKWDEHLKGADFFNVEKFPEMTFKSTKVEVTGEKTGKVTGDLTLLGVTKPVTLDVTYNSTGRHPYTQKMVSGFSATGALKRSDFGMTYALPGVGDDVTLRIEVEGEMVEAPPAANP